MEDQSINMSQSAFMGPKIWDKFDDDFKLEYMDLDEFLTENDLPIENVLQEQQQIEEEKRIKEVLQQHQQQQQQQQQMSS